MRRWRVAPRGGSLAQSRSGRRCLVPAGLDTLLGGEGEQGLAKGVRKDSGARLLLPGINSILGIVERNNGVRATALNSRAYSTPPFPPHSAAASDDRDLGGGGTAAPQWRGARSANPMATRLSWRGEWTTKCFRVMPRVLWCLQ